MLVRRVDSTAFHAFDTLGTNTSSTIFATSEECPEPPGGYERTTAVGEDVAAFVPYSLPPMDRVCGVSFPSSSSREIWRVEVQPNTFRVSRCADQDVTTIMDRNHRTACNMADPALRNRST